VGKKKNMSHQGYPARINLTQLTRHWIMKLQRAKHFLDHLFPSKKQVDITIKVFR